MSLIAGLTNQTIDTISSTSENEYGDLSKTTIYTSIPCRWWETEGRVHDEVMNLKDYKIEVWLLPDYPVGYNYIFTKDSEDYKIVRIENRVDLGGTLDHIKVYLV
jgi:hypothetical protein